MVSFFMRHWFLILLAAIFGLGYHQSLRFQPMLDLHGVRDFIVFCVMFAMGITLPAGKIRKNLGSPKPSLLAIFTNTFCVPLLVLPFYYFLPSDLFGGLFVTAIVPSTLASASVWTRRAGGDDAVSMMTTVVTNLGCVLVVPVGIWLVLGQQVQIDPWSQFWKLSFLVALPLVLSQITRRLGLADWADRNKANFSFATQLGILSMVFWGSVASASHPLEAASSWLDNEWFTISLLVFSVISTHCAAVTLGVRSAQYLGLPQEHQIAIGFSGGQKTLMVGLQIAIDCGVSVLPMIIYHLGQLVIDTLIADRWSSYHQRERHEE